MVLLPREEVQTLIYRGCARLAEAMQVKRIPEVAEQKWEDGVLQEAVRGEPPPPPTHCPVRNDDVDMFLLPCV